jgi:hypothetical protein
MVQYHPAHDNHENCNEWSGRDSEKFLTPHPDNSFRKIALQFSCGEMGWYRKPSRYEQCNTTGNLHHPQSGDEIGDPAL